MSTKFAKNVIKELNIFRSNPKSIQHQCELIQKGFSRLRANDPFLKEIETFVNELQIIKPLPELNYNKVLSESAEKELPKFRGRENYQKYRRSIKGIVPDYFLEASPALIADDGADEPINVLTKTLLNKLDKYKEGRSILCDPIYTQVGIAHEVFDEENMVILIFATKNIEKAPEPEPEPDPIRSSRNEFLFNIHYHETKDIKKPKYESKVHHEIKGNIFGGDNLEKMSYEMFSQGHNRPALEKNTFGQQLKSNKSELRMIGNFSSSRSPIGGAATKSTFESSSIRRRNEGTSTQSSTSSTRRFGPSSGTTTSTTTTTRTVTSTGGSSGTSGSSIRGRYRRF